MTIAMLMQTSTIFLIYIKKHFLYKLFFAITFFIYRLIIFPIYTYTYYINKYNEIYSYEINDNKFIVFIIFSINVLNVYWFNKIIKMSIKAIKELQ